jgi:SAP domain.
VDLKDRCRELGIKVSGSKQDLVARLQEAEGRAD